MYSSAFPSSRLATVVVGWVDCIDRAARPYGLTSQPVWLHPDGRIIDGRNRWLACRKLGYEAPTRTYDGPDDKLLAFVVSLNLHRRHLDSDQRAMVAAKVANSSHGGARQGANLRLGEVTNAEVAELFKVSERSIDSARKVLDTGDADLIAEAEQGRKEGGISVSAAQRCHDARMDEGEWDAAIGAFMEDRQRRLAALGSVAEGSAYLDESLRGLFCALIGSKYVAIVAGGQSTDWLIKQCRAIAKAHLELDESAKSRILGYLDRAGKLNEERKILHSLPVVGRDMTLRSKYHQHNLAEHPSSVEDIEAIGDGFTACAVDIHTSLTQMFDTETAGMSSWLGWEEYLLTLPPEERADHEGWQEFLHQRSAEDAADGASAGDHPI